MRSISYNLSVPKYLIGKLYHKLPASKHWGFYPNLHFSSETHEPELNGENWVKLRSLMSGICGSDMNLLRGAESFSMEPYTSFPFVLGHENVAEVVEFGKRVTGLKPGDRVVVDPVTGCEVQGRKLCANCAEGFNSLCENFSDKAGPLGNGMSLGYHPKTSGGWADYFQAHHSQVYPISTEIPLKRAVLTDPFCSALQAVAEYAQGKYEKQTILIMGAGTIGLLTVAAIRALKLNWKIIIAYKHPFQGKLAKKLGADDVLRSGDSLVSDLLSLVGGKALPVSLGKPVIEGGVDVVFDTIASPQTIDSAIRVTKPRGAVVLIGTATSLSGVDPTPLWFREVNLSGSCMSRRVIDPRDGVHKSCYQIAVDLLPDLRIEHLVTHEFPLEKFNSALRTSMSKNSADVVKVVFNVNESR